MSKANAETPSRAQQSCIGIDSTKPCAGRLATAGGVVRMTGEGGTLAGWRLLRRTVDFMGESAMRAVSLRGPLGRMPRFSIVVLAGTTPGRGGGGPGGFAGGGAAGFKLPGGADGSEALANGGAGGGRTGAFCTSAGLGSGGIFATAGGAGGSEA